jgi:hypothetical protein
VLGNFLKITAIFATILIVVFSISLHTSAADRWPNFPDGYLPMSPRQAVEIASDPEAELEYKLLAVRILLGYFGKPGVTQATIDLLNQDQDPEVIREIVTTPFTKHLKGISLSQASIKKLVHLLSFEGVKGLDRESAHHFSKVQLASAVRTFAVNLLGINTYKSEFDKLNVIRALFKYIDSSYDEYGPGSALVALHKLGAKDRDLVPRLLAALQRQTPYETQKKALWVLAKRGTTKTRRDVRLAVVHLFTDESGQGPRRDFVEDRDADVSDLLTPAVSALGLNEVLLTKDKQALTEEGVITVLESLMERFLTKSEVERIEELRARRSGSHPRLTLDLSAIPDSQPKAFAPRLRKFFDTLRAAGFSDLNPTTGIAEIRVLLETGLLGVKIPFQWGLKNPNACTVLLRDLGTNFNWENLPRVSL